MRHVSPLLLCTTMAMTGASAAQTGVIGTACGEDIERYCSEMSHIRGAVNLCLGQHMTQVSAECRTAMESAGPGNGRFGWGGPANRPAFMGLRQMLSAVEALGYSDLSEIEFEGGHYEIEATNSDGVRMELYIDAVTGNVISATREDD
jgi:hypothetical protein